MSNIQASGFRFQVSGRPTINVSVLLLLFSVYPAFSQYPEVKPVGNIAAFKQQFATESSKVLSISSNFTQEKILTALTEKITSEGKFWFKRSNKLRLEYIKPFAYLLVMNGDKIFIKDNQKENRFDVKSNKMLQQVNRIIIDCVQGTILESKDFSVKVFENDEIYLLELTPQSKILKEFFKTIVLQVEKKDYSVKSIEMNEVGADKTILTFADKRINDEIADAIFTF